MFNFSRIIALHNKLARRLKQFESVDSNTPLEVLNEYRYACRALVEAIALQKNPESNDFKHAEAKAYHALLNAYHDLVDGINMSLIDSLDKLSQQCLSQTIQVLGEKRFNIVKLTIEVDKRIAKTRECPNMRIETYEKDIYDKYFDDLLQYYHDIKIATQDIFTLCDKSKKKDKILITLAVLGVIIGIAGVLL